MKEETFLTQAEAAVFLQVKPKTLGIWRCTKKYNLPYIKIGGKVRYALSDLKNWLKERRVSQ